VFLKLVKIRCSLNDDRLGTSVRTAIRYLRALERAGERSAAHLR